MLPATHTLQLFAAFEAAMEHFVLTEGFQEGQDTAARVRYLTNDFFDMDIEEIEAIIAEDLLAA